MKLNNTHFDQASFSHKRAVLSLLWLRNKGFVPDALKVSYRDILFVYLEHYWSEKMNKLKDILTRLKSKLISRRG